MIIAIDGHSGAGKSTLAEVLQAHYGADNCNLLHMDDFFDSHERFYDEVLLPLKSGKDSFTYRKYNCQTGEYSPLTIDNGQLTIIEGVYSMKFHEHYDLRIFLEIDPEEQHRRLFERDPGKFDRFINEWIPAENKYFEEFQIKERSCLSLRI